MDVSTPLPPGEHFTTQEVARLLGMAVRSVQLMVDRGDLEAWRTPGGHRRIARASVQKWLRGRAPPQATAAPDPAPRPVRRLPAERPARARPRILLIEDSAHFQNLIGLLVREAMPEADLEVAADGIAGLALAGRFDPDVLIVDILLPGIDGATLITSLRSHPQFRRCRLIVVTSLDTSQREPYAFALKGLPVIHKTRVVAELPERLRSVLRPDVPADP